MSAQLVGLALCCALWLWASGARAGANDSEARENRLNWMLQCQGCHRHDGAETPGAVPALRGEVARFLSVPGGRAFLVRVPGVASAPLKDHALAALLNWMLREFDAAGLPQQFEPYRADEVRVLRARPLGPEVTAERARLLGLLPAR